MFFTNNYVQKVRYFLQGVPHGVRVAVLFLFVVFVVFLILFYAKRTRAVPGDFAVYRKASVDSGELIPTSATTMDFDTTVSEGSEFSIDSSGEEVTLSEAGHYLAMYNLAMETPGGTGTNRSEIQGQINLDGWIMPYGRSTCYIRREESIFECWMAGAAIFESTSTNQTLSIESYRTDSNSTGVKRISNESGLMLVRLDDAWDYARISEATGGQSFNSTTWSTVSWDTNDELDSNYSRIDGDITLGESGHYLVTYDVMFYNSSGAARRNNETRLTLDGYELPGTRVTAYLRGTNSTQNHVASFVGVIEATTTNQVLRLQGACEGEACGGVTGVGGEMGITIAKLPDTVEFVRLGYSADDQLVDLSNSSFSWDTQHEVDSNSFSHDTATNNSRINVEQDGAYVFFSSFYADRTSTTDGSRLQPHWEWRTNGTTMQQYGSFAKYNRGDQSTTGTFSSGASGGLILPSLNEDDYVEIIVTDEGSGTDNLAFYDSPKLGIQGIRLDSLITPEIVVSSVGTQSATSSISNTDFYIGASFYFEANDDTETVTSIKITETGSVDAQNDIDNVRLYYDLDTTSPYDCAGETYDGGESQYGATSTFSSANGSITFSDSVSVGTTSSLCLYVVSDVLESASDSETYDIEISDPFTDVIVTSGLAGPKGNTIELSGSTTLVDDELTQIHYHWRNDDGSESGATSATSNTEDMILSGLSKGTAKRVRIEVSNEGSVSSASKNYRIEYAPRSTTCGVATGWTDVGAVGGAWDMYDSSNLTDGNDTTNIAVNTGGVTDENTTFLTLNGGVKDTSSETGALTLSSSNFLELEYSVVPTTSASDGTTYCFRVTDSGTELPHYDVYPEVTISADVNVDDFGSQNSNVDAGENNFYIGGGFSLIDQTGSRNVTSITLSETGSVDAQNDIDNVRLYYDLDTTSPYDCAGETYDGSESQFGATSTFSSNSTSTFTDSVGISTTSAMCLYTVFDVKDTADNGDLIDIEISNPGNDVLVSSGTVNPNIPVSISGSTTIQKAILTQTHYHWRNDDGTESGASSETGGSEDTEITHIQKSYTQRLRIGVSNEGATTSSSTIFGLEYAVENGSCSAASTWTKIGDTGAVWVMSDSLNLTDGNDTTNIAVNTGGVTDENTTFLTLNGGVKDTVSTTTSLVLTKDEFTEFEYAIEPTNDATYGETYCFRVISNNEALPAYDNYPKATIRPDQDFYIQRGETTIGGSNFATITAGVDYVAPSASTSAFVRITNTQLTGAGRNNLGGNQNANTVTVYIMDPSNIKKSITFYHESSGMDTRVAWEIVEYTGPPDGDNEMKVRAAQTKNVASGDLTDTVSISGVSDDSDVVVFITGLSNPDATTGNYNRGLFTADWDDSSNEVVFEREESGTAINISYAVVEFTGINWRIQRAEHTYSSAGAWETETISTVNDIERAFLHVQKRSSEPGLDEHGHEIYLYDASTIRFQIQSGADSPSGQTSVAWVIENTQTNGLPMVVHRDSGSQTGGAEPSTVQVTIGDGATRDLNTTSIFTNNRVTGTGTAYPRPIMAVTLLSTTTYQLWISDTGQTRYYHTEVVDWPTAVLTLKQNYYRFYVDNDSLDPTDPWPPGATDLGENTSITVDDSPLGNTDVIRIRTSIFVSGANLSKDTKSFKLQYAKRTTTCGAISNWNDIGDSASTTAVWRGYNTSVSDGSVLSTDPPTSGDLNLSVSDRAGSFEESNPTATNTYKVLMGEDIEYDWALEANDVEDLTTYCFRMVENDNSVLDEYTYYPTLYTSGYTVEQFNWQWFDDENSVTPSSALAASNTAPSNVSQGNVIKLRVNLEELSGKNGFNTKYKLQYSESSDFSTVNDVVDMDNCISGSRWCYYDGAGVDNATITANVLPDTDSCSGGSGDGCGTHNEYPYVPLIIGEVGTTSVDYSGSTITLRNTYNDPIFIAEAITGDDSGGAANRPAAAIITATGTNSFTVKIQEPDNEDDNHEYEEVAYLVMERGTHELPDGTKVDVNSTTTLAYYGNGVSGTSDDTCVYSQTFSSTPLLLTALQSDNNTGTPDFLTASQALLTSTDFACSIEVPDDESNAPTNKETYGWIALEKGLITNNGNVIEATTTSTSITGWTNTPWYEKAFDAEYDGIPGILASKQARIGADGGWVRYDAVDSDSVEFAIDERGGERSHTSEPVGYFAFSKSDDIYDEGGSTDFIFTANTRKEFEFTIKHFDAIPNQTYFFRLYDVTNGYPVSLNSSSTYPSLATQSATLTFTVSGFNAGSSTEGVVTDATTTSTSIPFGTLTIGSDKVAAQRLTVTTNATEGYQILTYERQDLESGNGAKINDITGTNESPVAWSSGCSATASSCYGYHAGDDTLSDGSTRFVLDDTYAALTGSMAEVAYSSGPVTDESTDIVYRIKANASQAAGKYESSIVYIIVPVF